MGEATRSLTPLLHLAPSPASLGDCLFLQVRSTYNFSESSNDQFEYFQHLNISTVVEKKNKLTAAESFLDKIKYNHPEHPVLSTLYPAREDWQALLSLAVK